MAFALLYPAVRAEPTLFDISHQLVLPSTLCINLALFSHAIAHKAPRLDISVPLISFNVSALTGKRDEICHEYH
jgi:hypothetical protein